MAPKLLALRVQKKKRVIRLETRTPQRVQYLEAKNTTIDVIAAAYIQIIYRFVFLDI